MIFECKINNLGRVDTLEKLLENRENIKNWLAEMQPTFESWEKDLNSCGLCGKNIQIKSITVDGLCSKLIFEIKNAHGDDTQKLIQKISGQLSDGIFENMPHNDRLDWYNVRKI